MPRQSSETPQARPSATDVHDIRALTNTGPITLPIPTAKAEPDQDVDSDSPR